MAELIKMGSVRHFDMMKSDQLRTSARNNSVKDFEFAYFDNIDDALIEGLEQNKDFFSLLISNEEIKMIWGSDQKDYPKLAQKRQLLSQTTHSASPADLSNDKI